ncbi:SRPBCC family protein [Salinimicrobium terrae]|uniref:SRPBCC family protein n=1 Tax=Salinimicrobium terrae TaxID=470866 RepID=UPI0003F7B559|nr:SRPBCC family protein [Salinimicrobium terrae]
MEKDQMKNDLKEKRTRTRLSGQAAQNLRTGETGYISETQDSPIYEPGSPEVRVTREYNRNTESEDSKGNFLKKILSVAGIVAGGALIYKAVRGKGSSSKGTENIQLHTKQTIKRTPAELYAYWRNLENLPNFMSHIKDIREIDERRSMWTAEIPGGVGTIEWEAVIEQDRPNEYISWRSIADADIENAGEVRFKHAAGGLETIVETTISYNPPAGKAGEYAAKLFNPAFEKIVKNDLKQFKKHMEEGGEEKWRSEPTERIIY